MSKVKALAERLLVELRPFSRKIKIAGSIRRRVSDPRDIDILIIPRNKLGVYQTLNRGERRNVTSHGQKKIDAVVEGVQVNIVFTTDNEWAPALMYFTGPKGANIWNRKLASNKGLKLNQEGLFDLKTGKRIHTPTEKSIYDKLGKTYRRPDARGKAR